MSGRVAMLLLFVGPTLVSSLLSQVTPPPAVVRPPDLPPATKLEGFRPGAGKVVTLGYTELGAVSGIAVDVREFGQAGGSSARGVVVQVTQSEYREERSFVDADEIPELLRGFDALLEVKTNPTSFKNFEVQYTTKGELQITAFNDYSNTIRFSVEAGRTVPARRSVDTNGLRKLRALFDSAQRILAATPSRP